MKWNYKKHIHSHKHTYTTLSFKLCLANENGKKYTKEIKKHWKTSKIKEEKIKKQLSLGIMPIIIHIIIVSI
jgi:hypothetical protein